MNCKYIRETFLTDNKHRKLLVIKQSKGANLYLKCTTIRLAVGLRHDPLGELMRAPPVLSAMGVPTSKGREGKGRRRRGLLIREGREGE